MLRVALYLRVSTTKQDCDNQLLQLQEFARASGWEIAHVYTDDGVSGSGKVRRPAFEQMLLDASQKKFQTLLFWSLSRFSRAGVRETLRLLNQLESHGCAWRSFTEQHFDSAGIFKDVIISIMAVLAEQERLVLGERTRAGLQRARKQGKTLGRPTVGLDLDKVRAMRAEGLGLRAIAECMGCSASLLGQRLRAETRDGLLERIGSV